MSYLDYIHDMVILLHTNHSLCYDNFLKPAVSSLSRSRDELMWRREKTSSRSWWMRKSTCPQVSFCAIWPRPRFIVVISLCRCRKFSPASETRLQYAIGVVNRVSQRGNVMTEAIVELDHEMLSGEPLSPCRPNDFDLWELAVKRSLDSSLSTSFCRRTQPSYEWYQSGWRHFLNHCLTYNVLYQSDLISRLYQAISLNKTWT